MATEIVKCWQTLFDGGGALSISSIILLRGK